ncbi:MAG: DUF4954 family protein, partial [Bacteroidota bacterium]|nr:DUF4954 family protein [Bacteroidota bacterium]
PAELDIKMPFSLVNNNLSKDRLEVMPAFWWMYNMYALARNASKYQQRDKRFHKIQHIEFDAYAPDTIEEILSGMNLLELWTAKASLKKQGCSMEGKTDAALIQIGRSLLTGNPDVVNSLEVEGEAMEKSKRQVLILKPYKAYHAYRDMLFHYAMINLIAYFDKHSAATLSSMHAELKGKRQANWVNLGGQLMQKQACDQLRSDIVNGSLNSWKDIHDRYDQLWETYPADKQKHAYALLCELLDTDKLSVEQWKASLNKAVDIQQFITDQVYITREKDYTNHFRQITFENMEEMTAAIGTIEDNSFILQTRKDNETFKEKVTGLKNINR